MNEFQQSQMPFRSDVNFIGIPTSFTPLDRMTGGLHPGNLILIAGRPGNGRTTFVCNIARNVGVKEGHRVLFFSLEEYSNQIITKLISSESGINPEKLRFPGKFSYSEWDSISKALDKLIKTQVYIDDENDNLDVLCNEARRFYSKKGNKLGLVIIDYLQLIRTDKTEISKKQHLTEIMKALKSLAEDLKVPVIVTSQLSRSVEKRPDKQPMIGDLDIDAQTADLIIFLSRDEKYSQGKTEALVNVIVAKQNNGLTGIFKLMFNRDILKFEVINDEE